MSLGVKGLKKTNFAEMPDILPILSTSVVAWIHNLVQSPRSLQQGMGELYQSWILKIVPMPM